MKISKNLFIYSHWWKRPRKWIVHIPTNLKETMICFGFFTTHYERYISTQFNLENTMNIEQESKYDINDQGKFVNRNTGEVIPDNEPVMVFRAKDRKAVSALQAYHFSCTKPEHREAIKNRIFAFEKFAHEHPELMKEPD